MKKAAIYILGTALTLSMLAACGENSGTITTPTPTATVGITTPLPDAETAEPSVSLPIETDDLETSPLPSAAGSAEVKK